MSASSAMDSAGLPTCSISSGCIVTPFGFSTVSWRRDDQGQPGRQVGCQLVQKCGGSGTICVDAELGDQTTTDEHDELGCGQSGYSARQHQGRQADHLNPWITESRRQFAQVHRYEPYALTLRGSGNESTPEGGRFARRIAAVQLEIKVSSSSGSARENSSRLVQLCPSGGVDEVWRP